MTFEKLIFVISIIYLIFISLITFFTFGIDKSKAKNNKERIKEKTLLFYTAFGGALGAFIGRILFRHKTDKIYFSMTIYFSLLLEIVMVVVLGYLAFGR
jgi:uncharacterized membrane protein YsdA (DUF1294 family)